MFLVYEYELRKTSRNGKCDYGGLKVVLSIFGIMGSLYMHCTSILRVTYEMVLLCYDGLCVEYACDLCFYTKVHDDSQTWQSACFSTKMSFLACFQGFLCMAIIISAFLYKPIFSTYFTKYRFRFLRWSSICSSLDWLFF